MSRITAPVLLQTPKGWPEPWRQVFEALISPIALVRAMRLQIGKNSIRNKAAANETEPSMTMEELVIRFRDEALAVRQLMRETLGQLDGVAEKSHRAGCEIREAASSVIFRLTNEITGGRRYPAVVWQQVRKEVIDAIQSFDEIPLLEKLRDAIAGEKAIDLPVRPAANATAPIKKDERGRPRRTFITQERQRKIADEWYRFYDDGSHKEHKEDGTAKQQYCNQFDVDLNDLEAALRQNRRKKTNTPKKKRREEART